MAPGVSPGVCFKSHVFLFSGGGFNWFVCFYCLSSISGWRLRLSSVILESFAFLAPECLEIALSVKCLVWMANNLHLPTDYKEYELNPEFHFRPRKCIRAVDEISSEYLYLDFFEMDMLNSVFLMPSAYRMLIIINFVFFRNLYSLLTLTRLYLLELNGMNEEIKLEIFSKIKNNHKL